VALFILWVAFSLASYYLVQNAYLQPVLSQLQVMTWLGPAFRPEAVLAVALDILVALWLVVIALGCGLWLLHSLKLAQESPLEQILLAAGLGFGFLALAVLGLGLLGWLARPVLYSLTALLTIPALPMIWRWLLRINLSWPTRRITFYLVATTGLAFMLALQPPTSWDGLFYHLTGPRLFLEAGRIYPGIDIPHLSFPALFEMLFMLAMGLRGDGAAVPLHFIFNLMLAGLVYATARRHLQVENSWLSVLFFYAMPMVSLLAGWPYNDLPLAFYELAALYALLAWRAEQQAGKRKNGTGWLALAGILSGLAMGLKYTSFVAPVSFVLLILWWERRRLRQVWRPLLLFGGLAGLVVLPWLAKNLAFTGNPVYPFVYGGEYWDGFRAEAFAEAGTGIGYNPATCTGTDTDYLVGQHPTGCQFDVGYLLGRLVFLPAELTWGLQDASRDGDPGPLFLLFLPLLVIYLVFLKRPKPPAFSILALFALFQYLFWVIGVVASAALWQSRLLLPAFAALCPVLAWVLSDLSWLDRPSFSLQKQLHLVIGLVLLVGLVIQFVNWLPHQPWAYLTGEESRAENLRRRLGAHDMAMAAVNELPEDAVVYFLWEPRSYYCQRDCRPDSILDAYGYLHYHFGDAAGIARALQDQGVSHVLLFRDGLDFVLAANAPTDKPLPEPETLHQLLTTYLRPLREIAGGAYELYELNR
jgi:hypothetical protein